MSASPLEIFFNRYSPHFQYNPQNPATAEFQRLVEAKNWSPHQKKFKKARKLFKDALIDQFNFNYGKDVDSLTGWQALCEVLHVDTIPDTVSEARKIVKGTHVNLVDLADARGKDWDVNVFPTIAALRRYTLETDKIFNKERAKSSGLLRHLLRPIFV